VDQTRRRRGLWCLLAASSLFVVPAIVFTQGAASWRENSVIRVEPGPWTGRRLPDGQPDVQGFWSNTQGNHQSLTGRGVEGDDAATERGARGGGPPAGRDVAAGGRSRSRVTDPPDGEVPFQPWARAKVDELRQHLNNPTRPEYIEPLARCAPAGPTKSFMWHGYEIRQYPGYVLFFFGSSNRILHLDGKPHPPETIKLWNGDSRGHWEGNTLVVDVTNNNSKWRFARTGEFVSEHATLTERFTFASSGDRFLYQATYTDPTVLTRPFTISIPNKRVTADTEPDGWNNETFLAEHDGQEKILELWEPSCVEGNAGHGAIAVETK
jgi:hypothetical protein